jgi:hypothetical protein
MQPKKTWKTVRPIRIEGLVAYIDLGQGLEAIIDADLAPMAAPYNWSASRKNGRKAIYACRGRQKLHHLVMPKREGFFIDHINRDTLDCRRSNLRYVTRQQNTWNRSIGSANTSGFKGVFYRKDRDKWLAAITVDGKFIKIGLFACPKLAARARDAEAKRVHGEYAVLNFTQEAAE